jgi:Ca2+-binding RTX toxin-like protein
MSINSALSLAYDQLSNFAGLENFWSLFDTAFGTQYDYLTAFTLKSQWQSHDFSSFPQIEVVSNGVLGTANGAYAISTNKIYLSDAFISSASQQSLEAVILEEYGHFVDAQVNTTDTAGDEGELFSDLVRGVNLSAAELSRIKTEDDHAIAVIGGEQVAIEMATANGVIAFSNSQFSVNENGTPITQVTLTRTGGSTGGVSATLNLTDGTAFAWGTPNDYNNAPITVNFADGETSKTVIIPITDDNLIESSETINLTLADPTNGATIGTQNNAILTIVDNETSTGSLISQNLPVANYTASSIYTEEPDTGGTETAFDNDFSKYWNAGDLPTQWIEVDLGKEYALNTIQLLTAQLPDGNTTHEVWVSNQPIAWSGNGVLADTIQGFTTSAQWLREDFSNITIGRYVQIKTVASPSWVAWGKIEVYGSNAIPSITLAVTPVSVLEDGTPNLVYTFTRTGPTTSALTVNYTIAGTATNGTDYATIGTSVIFAANSATATVTVNPTADTTIEANETVVLTLATGTGYTIGTTTAVTGTITNDDPTITLAVAPTSVLEDGTPNLVYTFTRTGLTTNALTVNYSIAGTADATDYTGATPGTGKTITFLAGSATATLTVDPTADTVIEANETVALTLATGTAYTIGTTTAVTGTITNDDPTITLAVSPASVLEDGTPNLVYTFTRTGATTNALTVNYGITGTATNGTDYATIGTSVNFAANSATATVTVNPTADTTIENNETVALTLATGTSYTIGTTTAVTGTITNDDGPTISLGLNYSAISEDSPSNFIYTFTRTGATTNSLTVNYSIAGTALSTDYTGATPGISKTITFAAGSATATLTLDPTADTTLEPNETVILQLVSGTGYTIVTTAAQTATIINDDNTRNQQGTNGNSVLLGKNYSDYLTGGTGNDILNGAGNSDYLTGAAGNDTLTGGSGGDTFFFANANLGIDTITDFTPNEDTIFISASGFGSGLIAGNPLTQTQFILGSSATSASQRFIYNSTNGALLFDADGNGLGTAKQIATLSIGLALTCEDIFVG